MGKTRTDGHNTLTYPHSLTHSHTHTVTHSHTPTHTPPTHTHTLTHTHTYTHTPTHTYTHTHTHTLTHIPTHTHTYTHTTHTYTHTHSHTHIHTHSMFNPYSNISLHFASYNLAIWTYQIITLTVRTWTVTAGCRQYISPPHGNYLPVDTASRPCRLSMVGCMWNLWGEDMFYHRFGVKADINRPLGRPRIK